MKAGERFQVTEDIELEFIRVQHSIVDCVFAAIHTPMGTIVYANDFKIDRSPTLGEPPDFARLRALGKQGVLALITETTNASISGKTPSEIFGVATFYAQFRFTPMGKHVMKVCHGTAGSASARYPRPFSVSVS